MDEPIRIRGARQHNLKNIDVDLPRGALTVITGPSGSGKSSLALDTLFAAGQRRYVEALSTYAKQFLDRLEKPDVDRIEGLAPAVAIEQRNPTTTSRSTVGTATEVYDFVRLLFARVGRTHCPECGDEVRPDTISDAVDGVSALPAGARLMIAFPLSRSGRVSHRLVAGNLRSLGFARVLADGAPAELSELLAPEAEPGVTVPDLAASREVLVVVDRIKAVSKPDRGWRDRLADSLATCFREGEGEAVVVPAAPEGAGALRFSEAFRCPRHPGVTFLEPEPKLFSFNNPYGSCPACTGFGATLEYDPGLIVPNGGLSLEQGAVDPWAKPRYSRERAALHRFANREGVSPVVPWDALPASFRDAVLYGKGSFRGVVDFLVSRERKRYKPYIRIFLRRYQRPLRCRACGGSRLRPEAGQVSVGGLDIGGVSDLPIDELPRWLSQLELRPMETAIAAAILRELAARVGFLVDVGLGYLTLGRQMRTLSGGEAQRISLANSLGSRLVDTLYVLDEPSIGLHPQDIDALLALLRRLRDGGNTVVVVEHAAPAILSADHVVELGPGSGERGGEVVFEGSPTTLTDAVTNTGQYLSRNLSQGAENGEWPPKWRRPVDGARLRVEGATLHNLRGVEAEFPVGALTVVTGVSGSGKSTLVHDVLFRALEHELKGGRTSAREHLGEVVGAYTTLSGLEHLEDVVLVDQSPIGRTPRSNPVTYVRAWGEIRRIFARERAARAAGLDAGSFSFNVKGGGRCEECAGAGFVRVEMVFMADIHVPCEVCGGKRYRPEVLEVKVRGHDVSQVLDFTVDRAMRFFVREPKLGQALWHLQQVGLGYLRLGQPATHLSGGEAQRLKIARELIGAAARRGSRSVYILDEPTTGLSGDDVALLNRVLRKLVRAGNTLVVVEHDLDVIRAADWVVDMGPGAGGRGGRVVAMGRPEDIATVPESVTGRFLRDLVAGGGGARAGAGRSKGRRGTGGGPWTGPREHRDR
ncbi:MAG: excinuclease ABC subunit UvrA [Gemmatimonadota bacterium]|nr:excinuclease ABC subunit UvrA [Gemmatimonadota bacterium]MDE2871030.1 excinuclease ABC subunit UvrA [Gemmatimonadota bacterium]